MFDEVQRALTWCQPVASAHAAGNKPIENRRWKPALPTDGSPLLLGLHAGTRWWDPDGPPTSRPNPRGLEALGAFLGVEDGLCLTCGGDVLVVGRGDAEAIVRLWHRR